jgi:hypothetical protein
VVKDQELDTKDMYTEKNNSHGHLEVKRAAFEQLALNSCEKPDHMLLQLSSFIRELCVLYIKASRNICRHPGLLFTLQQCAQLADHG